MVKEAEKLMLNSGNIPVLYVSGENIPEAWEKTMLDVWDYGVEVKTEYDKKEDPPSKDATVTVEIKNPFGEPRIHKNLPGGPVDLEIYRQEVVYGIHDHWINPLAGKWTYTYHERLFNYNPPPRDVYDLESMRKRLQIENDDVFRSTGSVDQIEYIVEKLSKVPYSRRVQAITWMPTSDPKTDDPPCLQRVWCRILPDEQGNLKLNMNTHWRSRDLYKAWFMNVFALTDLQRLIAEKISEKRNEEIKIGRYVDISDSLHIYGSYMNKDLEVELEKMRTSSYKDRAWNSEFLEPMFEEVRENLARDVDFYAKGQH